MSDFTKRRIQLIYALSLMSAFFALVFFIVGLFFDNKELRWIHIISALILLMNAFLVKKGNLQWGRLIYFITFNLGVTLTAIYLGKESSVEFLLLFSLSVPFFMFSFETEKKKIFSFSAFSLVLWVLLYQTNFYPIPVEKIDPNIVATYFYPLSIITTIVMVTFTLQYFSYLNSTHYSKAYTRKDRALEASAAKSKFLSMMSHEIRTPLNAIVGLSHILSENKPRIDQKENIDALQYSSKVLLGLLNNVLDFSKMQSTKIELDEIATDLHVAIRQIRNVHEANCLKKGIELKILIDENIPSVQLDIVRFNQIINNLLGNAIKFTEKGTVTLRIKKGSENNNKINIITEVIDTGIGIPRHKKEEIWEAFTQASVSTTRLYGGTGLGLPIVKSIVEAMGSEVKVDSYEGKGSRFYFKLNLEKTKEKDRSELGLQKASNLENKKILIVDDSLINIMVGKQLLEKENILVTTANNGLEAVEKAKELDFDMILMDLQMPIMDGYTASKEIRKFNDKTPILALSGEFFTEVKDKINACGMNGFILKPFDPKEFIQHISEYIQSS